MFMRTRGCKQTWTVQNEYLCSFRSDSLHYGLEKKAWSDAALARAVEAGKNKSPYMAAYHRKTRLDGVGHQVSLQVRIYRGLICRPDVEIEIPLLGLFSRLRVIDGK